MHKFPLEFFTAARINVYSGKNGGFPWFSQLYPPSYLSHVFKNDLHISIHKYVLEKRLILANKKIRQSVNPTVAASECGFADYSAFYRQYKKCSECLLQSQRQRLTANNSVALNSRIFANEQGKKANFIFREALSRLCGINSTAQTQRKELVFSTLCGCEPLQYSQISKGKRHIYLSRNLAHFTIINSSVKLKFNFK